MGDEKPQALRIALKVEQRHIDAGVRGEPHTCPISLALREIEPRFKTVWTFPHGVHVVQFNNSDGPKLGIHVASFPFTTRQWVHEYDTGETVLPFAANLTFVPVHSEVRHHRV